MNRPFQSSKIIKPRDFENGFIQFAEQREKYASTDLEIGCGVGFHPIQYAKQNPDRLLIAIEKTHEKFDKFKRRLENHHSLTNLIAVHADAIAWVTHALSENSIDNIFILYPNPNQKNQSQRWIRMPFMSRLIEILKPDGNIEIATNISEYADEIKKYADKWGLGVGQALELRHGSISPRTHFEKKYLIRGEVCYNLTLKKKS